MLLRHLSAELDLVTAMLSKMERGEKTAKREHVLALSKLFQPDSNELTALWLPDQVSHLVENEDQAEKAIRIALKEIVGE
jgi:hypothetical protein